MLLFGDKTLAVFDVWSIEHFVSGMCFGSLIPLVLQARSKKISSQLYFITVFAIAMTWEVLEHYLETGLAGNKVVHWFQGVEFILNRALSDPLLLLLGAYVVRLKPRLALTARLFSLGWLTVHIFVFEHSMVLQDWLLA